MTFVAAYVLVIFAYKEGAVAIPGYATLDQCVEARTEIMRQTGAGGAYAYCIPGPSR